MQSHLQNRFMQKVRLFLLVLIIPVFIFAQETDNLQSQSVELNYISPDELISSLSISKDEAGRYLLPVNNQIVEVGFNYSFNHIILTGTSDGIAHIKSIIELLDLPPRQIIIEAKIVEIDNEKSRDIGLDWQGLLDNTDLSSLRLNLSDTEYTQKSSNESTTAKSTSSKNTVSLSGTMSTDFSLGEILRLLQESGTGKIVNVPHIVTTNNKEGTIFDGKKINYVAKVSSYSNILETNEIDAGLMLKVKPSLGKSGYMKLNVLAKFTSLEYPHTNTYRTSFDTDVPIESGQTLENCVIIKNEESLVLGGFKKTEYMTYQKKFPILGTLLPFLFSRDIKVETTKDVLIILKPKIIDLETQSVPELK